MKGEKCDKGDERGQGPKGDSGSNNKGDGETPKDALLVKRKVPAVKRRQVFLTSKSGKRAIKSSHITDQASLLHTEETGLLQPENELEHTLHVRQTQIRPHLDMSSTAKASFHLDLESTLLAPYINAMYSRTSRSLLVASRKGHVSVSNWRNLTSRCEIYLNETVRDATFLHNDAFFATAQKLHTYIYDGSGAQVHVLRSHQEAGSIVSLPHHLLLATVSASDAPHSRIVYTDTTTGELAGHLDYSDRTLGLSAAHAAAVNSANGVLHVAHHSGAVSMWSPTMDRPLARVFLHAGGARHIAILPSGDAMVSVGANAEVKITDLRTFRTRASWRVPAMPTALAASQRGLVAVAFGATVQVFTQPGSVAARTARVAAAGATDGRDGGVAPYMMETFAGRRLTGLDFCPFEDVLAVCHQHGMLSMMVPGAGVATFDSAAPNPYETRKQRREKEVRMLLDRLPADTIGLDASFVGSVDVDPERRLHEMKDREREANLDRLRGKSTKRKVKGRDKISKRVSKRKNRMMEANRVERQEGLEQQRETQRLAKTISDKEEAAVAAGTKAGSMRADDLPSALQRFVKK